MDSQRELSFSVFVSFVDESLVVLKGPVFSFKVGKDLLIATQSAEPSGTNSLCPLSSPCGTGCHLERKVTVIELSSKRISHRHLSPASPRHPPSPATSALRRVVRQRF